MDGVESATIVAAGAVALIGFLAAPALLRRAAQWTGLAFARALGRMRPFAGPAHVIDGDTIVVRRVRVRIYGMDAPEMGQAGGPAARAHLQGLIGAAAVEVAPIAIDRYGRTVARVRREGRDLGQAMVADGYARAMTYWSFAYLGAELAARRRRRGLWAACRLRGIGDPAAHRRAVRRRLR